MLRVLLYGRVVDLSKSYCSFVEDASGDVEQFAKGSPIVFPVCTIRTAAAAAILH